MKDIKKISARMAFWSAIAVAVFTLLFVITLITTFSFDAWEGIDVYAKNFKPLNLVTVIPSIFLAITFLIFCVSVHYFIPDERKIWSHLAMNFGLVYITISIANYLIQLITVMPSVMNDSLNGLDKMVSGYPNSIFYALMSSYFFMCISLFFEGLVFKKWIRFFLSVASIVCIVFFILGALFSISIFMMVGAVSWILGTIISMVMISVFFYRQLNQNK